MLNHDNQTILCHALTAENHILLESMSNIANLIQICTTLLSVSDIR